MFKDLSPIWQQAFIESWQAFREGCIPIGAIITDAEGNIISRGHNMIFSSPALNPRLLHAEISCMMNLDTKKYPDLKTYILYTTMEPCPMCMGSITMGNIRNVHYSAHDDNCGATFMAHTDRYISSKKIAIIFDDNGMEDVQLTLQSWFEINRSGHKYNKVLEYFIKRSPESYVAASRLHKKGYFEKCIENNTSEEEIFDTVTAICEEIREKSGNLFFTARIEQTNDYPQRMKYVPETDSFVPKDCSSLSYDRGVSIPYGWIVESGSPPNNHLDVLIMTDKKYELGDTDPVRVIGVFCRNDCDHKLVAVLLDRNISDLSELTDKEKEDLNRLYPVVFPGEGWFGADRAREVINDFRKTRKKKTIYLVQHCESEHHVNGMIGAWTNWNLTELGHKQAQCIGEWMLETEFKDYKDYKTTYTKIYCSTLNRAMQTAEEIMKSVNAPITYCDSIREVNAGAAHGKSREWNREHEAPHPDHYDPDYRPYPDADSDRDLWNRIYPFYREIMDNDVETIIVVSHGCTLSFLQSMLVGHTDVSSRAIFAPHGPAGSVSKFVLDPSGRMSLHYLNKRPFSL